MKQILASMMLCLSLVGQAQKNEEPKVEIPAWGKVTIEELQMKKCDFDDDASAVMLLNFADVYYEYSPSVTKKNFFRIRKDRRIRIKILNEKGFEKADVKIRFYAYQNFEFIQKLQATTFNLDDKGQVVATKLDFNDVITTPEDKYYSVQSFTFPAVKVGSVLEYRYTVMDESEYDGASWIFQQDIPVKVSQYNISIPEYYKASANFLVNRPVIKKEDTDNQTISINASNTLSVVVYNRHYTMLDVPALKFEPNMTGWRDWLQRVEFNLRAIEIPGVYYKNYNTTWGVINRGLLERDEFGGQLDKTLADAEYYLANAAGKKTNREKIVYLYDAVRKKMDWNNQRTKYTESVKDAWKKASGNSADINFSLLILLRKAGIEAYPLCVSTHEHGRVNMVSPDPSQFNAVDVLVIDGEQLYVLDATDRLTPYFLVPQNILNTEAYMIDKEKEGWVTISDGVRKEKTVVSVSASIDAEGKMSGESVVSSFEYAKVSRIKKLSQGYKTFRDAFFEANNNDFKMDSVKISHRDNDSLHLEQKFSFERKLSNSDGYTHFGINLFAGFDKNPFLSSTRSSDIDFGVLRSTTILGSYEIPEGFEFEELPKNTAMIMPDTSIVLRRIMQADGNQLSVRINVDFKRSLYYPAEYDEFKEFYKKLFAVLNEEVVIRKKAKK